MTIYEENIQIEKWLAQMTDQEKISLTYGTDNKTMQGVPRLGIPAVTILDGPNGLRWSFHSAGEADAKTSAAPPTCISNAASFSRETAEKMGRIYGLDCRASNVTAIFGPGMNLMRTPLGGRNFEYLGEDPYLTGKIGAAIVEGCQKLGVSACPKHLALNDQEVCRTIISSNVDERTVRELYLYAFELTLREGKPWMVMSSYNRYLGQYVSESGFLQDLLPKREWGYDGVIVSDWGGGYDAVGCAYGGLDLGMPGEANPFTGHLAKAVASGAVPISVVEEKARRILRFLLRVTQNLPPCNSTLGGTEQQTLCADIAADSMVLLKNEKNLLPLSPKKIRRLAVLGPNADLRQHRGTLALRSSSGAIFTEREITPLTGLQKYAKKHNIQLDYYPIGKFSFDKGLSPALFGKKGLLCEIYQSRKDFEAGKAPLASKITDGVNLLWPTTLPDPTKNNWYPKLGLDSLFYRVKGTITPPDAKKDGSLLIMQWISTTDIYLNGKPFSSIPGRSIGQQEIPFPAGCGPQEIECLIDADGGELSGIELHWQESEEEAIQAALPEIQKADAVIFIGGSHRLHDREAIGRGDVPGADLPDLELPEGQNELISRVAAVNPNLAVVLMNGTPLDVEPWVDQVQALVSAFYPGEQGGNAIAKLLFGEQEAAGRLPFTWAKRLEDYAPHALDAYPGTRRAELPQVEYKEGLLMGYRWFERQNIAPRYPFGYGLSYTTFQRELLETKVLDSDAETPAIQVKLKVTNTGSRPGADVVQLYLGGTPLATDPTRPLRELRGFDKVRLEPGESKEITLELRWRDFAHWFPEDKRWKVLPGSYRLDLATSAAREGVFASAEIEITPQKMPMWVRLEASSFVAN